MYSPFVPLKKDIEKQRKTELESNDIRRKFIKEIISENNLHKLQSDYLGMDSYYYDEKNNKIYRCWTDLQWSVASCCCFD